MDRNGDTVWEKTYGGSKSDIAESLVNTDNGNYLIVGYTYSFGNGDSDVYLIKIDKDGNKIWQKTFGGKKRDVGESIVKVSGGYLIAGHTYSFGEGKSDVYLIKTASQMVIKFGRKVLEVIDMIGRINYYDE